MFSSTTKALMAKEWQVLALYTLYYAGGGLLAISLNFIPGQKVSFASSVLLITVFIAFYCHSAMRATITEQKEKNHLFLMTLPVSARKIFFIKMLVNWALFTGVWLLFMAAIALIILFSDRIPSMALSSYLLIFSVFIPAYCIILGVGMITKSESWTILAFIICNISCTVAINLMSSNAEVQSAFSLGTFSEIGLYWPSWAPAIFMSVIGITLAGLLLTSAVGFFRKDFF